MPRPVEGGTCGCCGCIVCTYRPCAGSDPAGPVRALACGLRAAVEAAAPAWALPIIASDFADTLLADADYPAPCPVPAVAAGLFTLPAVVLRGAADQRNQQQVAIGRPMTAAEQAAFDATWASNGCDAVRPGWTRSQPKLSVQSTLAAGMACPSANGVPLVLKSEVVIGMGWRLTSMFSLDTLTYGFNVRLIGQWAGAAAASGCNPLRVTGPLTGIVVGTENFVYPIYPGTSVQTYCVRDRTTTTTAPVPSLLFFDDAVTPPCPGYGQSAGPMAMAAPPALSDAGDEPWAGLLPPAPTPRGYCRHLALPLAACTGCTSGWQCGQRCTSRDPTVLAHLGGDPADPRCVPGASEDCGTCPGFSPRG